MVLENKSVEIRGISARRVAERDPPHWRLLRGSIAVLCGLQPVHGEVGATNPLTSANQSASIDVKGVKT